MKIENTYPPNFDAILAAFPNAGGMGVLFCYGDTIHYPRPAGELPPQLIAHEKVHSLQQTQHGATPDWWWAQYIADPEFRLNQEMPAHAMELFVWTHNWSKDRHYRKAALSIIAHRLAGPLYNRLLPLHKAESFLRRAMKEHAP